MHVFVFIGKYSGGSCIPTKTTFPSLFLLVHLAIIIMASQNPFRLALFFLLFLFGHLLEAANLETDRAPEGKLGVRLDYALATESSSKREANHRWLWSSHLVFKEEVASITDGQLKQLAIDAFEEMRDSAAGYELETSGKGRNTLTRYLPSVMTIMALDKEIIFSSSQKGKSGFIDKLVNSRDDNPMKELMIICQSLWSDIVPTRPGAEEDSGHTNDLKCGEIFAFYLYYQDPNHKTRFRDMKTRPRVTTVLGQRPRGAKIISPCGTKKPNKDEPVSNTILLRN